MSAMDSRNDTTAVTRTKNEVWLPFPPDELDDAPGDFTYRQWDGEPDFPADPADCAFYTVPYMKPPEITLAPLAGMRSVRVVQTMTAGTDDIQGRLGELHELHELPDGVRLCSARGVHDASTAELALTLVLSSLRRVPEFVAAQREGRWLHRAPGAPLPPSLADRSVLLVGYGSVGAAVEDRLAPFEPARVARIARSARTTARGPVHPLTDLHRLLPDADVVVLTTPLTGSTRHLVDGDFLRRMKDGALLVNMARGAVVDTEALLAELRTGRITAALDVTDPEPLPGGHPLWDAPGVLISPHTGGATEAFPPRVKRLLSAQLRRFARGEDLANVVLETGSRG